MLNYDNAKFDQNSNKGNEKSILLSCTQKKQFSITMLTIW